MSPKTEIQIIKKVYVKVLNIISNYMNTNQNFNEISHQFLKHEFTLARLYLLINYLPENTLRNYIRKGWKVMAHSLWFINIGHLRFDFFYVWNLTCFLTLSGHYACVLYLKNLHILGHIKWIMNPNILSMNSFMFPKLLNSH